MATNEDYFSLALKVVALTTTYLTREQIKWLLCASLRFIWTFLCQHHFPLLRISRTLLIVGILTVATMYLFGFYGWWVMIIFILWVVVLFVAFFVLKNDLDKKERYRTIVRPNDYMISLMRRPNRRELIRTCGLCENIRHRNFPAPETPHTLCSTAVFSESKNCESYTCRVSFMRCSADLKTRIFCLVEEWRDGDDDGSDSTHDDPDFCLAGTEIPGIQLTADYTTDCTDCREQRHFAEVAGVRLRPRSFLNLVFATERHLIVSQCKTCFMCVVRSRQLLSFF
eukprot:TRINITY_DN8775_c0_g1_i1.p1 TRINITY_DN8775_c0_g1~~TRINITY_DN8775_c0_g1_i1.p1  ORF type:complete len:328 (-),score=-0.76 TRINITY_DN8775_c0_g1_i1:54-902(-)